MSRSLRQRLAQLGTTSTYAAGTVNHAKDLSLKFKTVSAQTFRGQYPEESVIQLPLGTPNSKRKTLFPQYVRAPSASPPSTSSSLPSTQPRGIAPLSSCSVNPPTCPGNNITLHLPATTLKGLCSVGLLSSLRAIGNTVNISIY